MTVIAVDTGRDMRPSIRAVLAGVRHVARRLKNVSVCALGDYRCHLLQTATDADRLHVCGLDRSFELAMYYYARHGAGRGTIVFCGTGPFRDAVSAAHVRMLGDAADRHLYTQDVFEELRARHAVRMLYVSRGVYDTDVREWESLLGKRSVTVLEDPRGTARALLALVRGAHG